MTVTAASSRISPRIALLPRSGIRAVLEAARPGETIDLAAGDPSFPTPPHIVAAAAEAAARGATHYTHGRGDLELRAAIARKLETENGIVAEPESEIVVTAGALNALAAALIALVGPGDEVLVPDPGFANYQAQVALAGGIAVPVPLADDWSVDVGAVEQRLGPRTRVLVVNSPSNPTGAVTGRPRLEDLARILADRPVTVISDEAYERLVYAPARHVSVASLPALSGRTVSIFSFSKTYAMTGWRLGYLVAPREIADGVTKVQEHLIGCASSISQAAGLAALRGPVDPIGAMVCEYERRRSEVMTAFADVPTVELVEPAGAFYAFVRVPSSAGDAAVEIASATAVLTVPGEAFGARGRGHIRVSYAGSPAALSEGLHRVRQHLAGGFD